MMVSVRAPAKVNLCLHITGQQDDGYHLIDSLVSFGAAYDELDIFRGDTLSLTVEGPEKAGVPSDGSNLVLMAADLLAQGRGATFTLVKNLPAASGIGGGSADAAAAFRGGLLHWGETKFTQKDQLELFELYEKLADIGADIPMCLASRPLRARGIGQDITPIDDLPDLPVILVNPRIPVSTPSIFENLKSRNNPPLPEDLPEWSRVVDFCAWLEGTRNDLQTPAISLHPEIGAVLDKLPTLNGALFSRMSGSGATCFAIFENDADATDAMEKMKRDQPGWWTTGGWLRDCTPNLFANSGL